MLLVSNELAVVKNCYFIFSKTRNPVDLESTRLRWIGKNRNINLVVVLGLLAMFASVWEGDGAKLSLGHLVLIIGISNVDVHNQSCASYDL